MSQSQNSANGGADSGDKAPAPATGNVAGGNNATNNGNDSERADREASKRLAQQGQWRTPPLPLFAAGAAGTIADSTNGAAPAANSSTTTLPTTPEEYARMLQEAYRRGAEAGARAQPKSTSASGVPSSTTVLPQAQRTPAPASIPQPASAAVASGDHSPTKIPVHATQPPGVHGSAGMPPPPTVQYMMPPPIPSPLTSPMNTSMNSNIHAHPATSTSATATGTGAVAPVPVNVATYPNAPVTSSMPAPGSHIHPQYHHPSVPVTGAVPTAQHAMPAAPPGVGGGGSVAAGNRSVSLPDMSSYAAHANDEEEKRKKRLARNRASARLRRLKKKNLVDSYEGEVGILESALSKLKSHRWGTSNADSNNHEALIEALSMERGQQPLTSEKRRELIQSIIMQQREQVANLMECQLENWMLGMLAVSSNNNNEGHSENGNNSKDNNSNDNVKIEEGSNNAEDSVDQELNELTSELQSILQLSPEQMTRIQQSSHGCEREIQDLFTVDNCLESILNNQWLLDEGVDEVAGQFTSILNQTQMSKFLLWSDHNADAIEKLDYVNVASGVENGPVFEFGIDEGLEGGD